MKVLIACESSGAVRDAFTRAGHDAISCDLLPSIVPGAHHQGDALAFMRSQKWDLIIAHPPCQFLTVAGMHWNGRASHARGQDRDAAGLTFGDRETLKALDFVRAFLEADCPRIAVENPVSVISTRIRKPDQTIQPFQFGHPESKRTCLWLKGLPLLRATNVLPLPASGRWSNQTASGQNKLAPSPNRWRLRSATYAGIADAMAAQWGAL